MVDQESGSPAESRWLKVFLLVIGSVSLLAFGAAVMPSSWIREASESLGFDPFPESPLTFYLARNLSLVYGFVGTALLVIASDLNRYRPLVRYAAWGTVLFGVLQCIVDHQAAMPGWWTWGESMSTVVGGSLLWWLDHKTPATNS